jgi:VWFA-related protein
MSIPVGRRHYWPLSSLLLFCVGTSPTVAGDPAKLIYRSNVTEVRLNFSAADQNNHGVATLQASDFAVVDSDVVVRNFQSFTRSDWTKLEIAILIDASESVTPRFSQEMADILHLVSSAEGVPPENLSIFSFEGSRPALLCAGDCRASQAAGRLPEVRAHGLTPLFDTIVFAEDYLAHHGDARAEKTLIVFSDGVDSVSQDSLGDALDASVRSEVQLDCIDLNKSAYGSQGAAILRNLASATGGRYFSPPEGTTGVLNALLEELRANYIVTYRLPSRAPGFNAVRILPTHNLKLQFRSRIGYYYPNQVQ